MSRQHNRHPRRTGYSLLELLIAIPLSVVVVAAAGSAIFVASRARVLSEGLLNDKLESLILSEAVLRDTRDALSIAERSQHALELSVPDRNGDDVAEILRYEWSGTAGDPVYYTFNDEDPFSLAANVHVFDLEYVLRTPELFPGEDGLSLIKYHNDAKKGKMKDWKIESSKWFEQYFLPDLPPDATAWDLHRVRLLARTDGDLNGVTMVKITTADVAHQPTTTVLEEGELLETDLDKKWAWSTVEFWTLKNLDPDEGICIVLAYESGVGKTAQFRYEEDGLNMTPDTHFMKSFDAGMTWTPPGSDDDLRFFVYGTHDGTLVDRKFVVQAQCRVQLGADPQTLAESTVNVLNAPEVGE